MVILRNFPYKSALFGSVSYFMTPVQGYLNPFLGYKKTAEMSPDFDELFHYIRFPQAFQHEKILRTQFFGTPGSLSRLFV